MNSRWSASLLAAGLFLLAGCDDSEEVGEARTETRKGRDGLYGLIDNQRKEEGKFHQFLLGPGDRIVRDPDGGVDPFDAAKSDPQRVGTYRLEGTDRMTIQWGDGSPAQTVPVMALKDGPILKYDGQLISKAPSYGADAKLSAVYFGIFGFAKDEGIRRVTGRVLQFNGDSKFLTGITTDPAGEKFFKDTVLTGTYTLGGNTLALHFADGTETRHTVVPINHDNDKPYDHHLARAKDRYEWWLFDRERLVRTR